MVYFNERAHLRIQLKNISVCKAASRVVTDQYCYFSIVNAFVCIMSILLNIVIHVTELELIPPAT